VAHTHYSKCTAATVVLFFTLVIKSPAQFETRSSSPIIYEPQAVAVGDFNHDGKLDVAAAAWYTGQVAVLLGKGDGTFQPPVYYAIDSNLESVPWVAAGDFRGNGNVDLAVADEDGLNISVLLGNGDGTFQSPVQYHLGSPNFVAVGDFNNDGKPDLIAADGYGSVLLGNGDGTFQPPIDNGISTSGEIPLAVGDFNNDGNLDVAVLGPFPGNLGLGILLGNGDGTFRQGAEYAVGEFANSITVGDFNGDRKLDLAVSNGTGNQIYILLGNGDGTFQPQPPFFANGPGAITTADVNSDGKPDLLFLTQLPSGFNQFTVMLGNGDGTFQPPANYGSFSIDATDIAVGDFNGDRKPDVAVADFRGEAVDVLLNTGVVNFSPTTPLRFPTELVGTTGAAQNVTLTNTGTTALSITSKRVSGPFQLASGTTCGSSVAPGANCTLSVAFAPTVIGFKGGLLSLSDSASSKPQVIELGGTGTVISLSPTQLNFGSQKVGTYSPPQKVTVTNTGSTTVNVTSVKIAGNNSKDYSETNTCGSQIGPGGSCTISVTFAPTKTGIRNADAQISDTGGGSPQQVPLTGTGT
jgi:FG-GAP-like repeat/Cep192 domain 4/Abnormal spindle-like microcephaly-assoc'd, ASPM-SPD-2-Hydin